MARLRERAERVGQAEPANRILAGNHDPVKAGSVFHPDHAFRKLLPDWVHVVDSERFELALTPDAVLFAAPCTSMAGAEDLALTLPCRSGRRCPHPSGVGPRIHVRHGGIPDQLPHRARCAGATGPGLSRGRRHTRFPSDHGERRGADRLPGAPEQTRFGESGGGQVAVVMLQRSGARPIVTSVKVGRWSWRDESATSLESLRSLAAEDLSTTVLRLRMDMTVSVLDEKEVDLLTRHLRGDAATSGRAGAFVLDRSGLRVEVGDVNALMKDAPETLSIVAAKLAAPAAVDDEARRALNILYRLMSEAQS